ncbi:MAG: FAD-dependent oxidoreductase [Ktedonobacteraceae bacterium]|nr:FAD-dependent oxidoreductase [Ktedonobacteraceae bacterium]
MYQKHIVIVGAGIVGLSTAYALLAHGCKRVTVLEQAAVDHPLSTSRGLSRLLRFEYGAHAWYSDMVRLSLRRWKALERVTQRQLYMRTGVLVLGRDDDQETLRSYYALRELGIDIEQLSRSFCMQRFPQFNLQPYNVFTYNKHGGMLLASSCLRVLKDLVLDLGGRIVETARVTRLDYDSPVRPICLYLGSGEVCLADQVVLALGPWVHGLLEELRLPVRLTRQYVLYFTGMVAPFFKYHTFPSFMADDLYGFPIHNSCAGSGPGWLKVTSHRFGSPVVPGDALPIETHVIERIRREAGHLLPALRSAEIAHIDTCMYDVSQDEDFILDLLPGDERIVLATGMSGHAFKFGPLLGEMVGSMVLGTEAPVPLERFAMTRFSHFLTQSTMPVA